MANKVSTLSCYAVTLKASIGLLAFSIISACGGESKPAAPAASPAAASQPAASQSPKVEVSGSQTRSAPENKWAKRVDTPELRNPDTRPIEQGRNDTGSTKSDLVLATVVAIDANAFSITLQHDDLSSNAVVAATTQFATAPSVNLAALAVNDQLRVTVVERGGELLVTRASKLQ